MTGQIKKFVLAQKKIKSETVETYYKKLKNNEKRNKAKSNVQGRRKVGNNIKKLPNRRFRKRRNSLHQK